MRCQIRYSILLAAALVFGLPAATQDAGREPPPETSPPEEAPTAPAGDPSGSRDPARVDLREVYRPTPLVRAIDRGLVFLSRTQLADGSWESSQYGKNTGIVSLALMAFLARGHEPGRGIYGEAIERGIAWILQSGRDGVLHRQSIQDYAVMYSHGMATLLLGEVAGMVDERRPEFAELPRILASAVDVILRAQSAIKHPSEAGGWRYQIDSRDSDISVTGWQLLALRAAQESGIEVPKSAIDKALSFVRTCAVPDGGFRYTVVGPKVTAGLTGTGILALEICGEHHSPEAIRGGDWLLRHRLDWSDEFFYYGAYYSAQAMYQLGGTYWERWRALLETSLLPRQTADGSWELPASTPQEAEAGKVYTTAMAILALSVEFRYLPIYQR